LVNKRLLLRINEQLKVKIIKQQKIYILMKLISQNKQNAEPSAIKARYNTVTRIINGRHISIIRERAQRIDRGTPQLIISDG